MFGDSQRADIGTAGLLGCDGIFLNRYAIKSIDPTMPAPTYIAPSLADTIEPYVA
jgi:FMN phosphatase YigB (HAD superfamily)